jgi:uncharacterized protein GlcG (DUF336 family)
MKKMLLTVLSVLALPASAQVAESGYALPLKLAVEAAMTAVDVCAAKGYPVTATIVDSSGVVKVQLKGDHSTIHTKDTAYKKAYTVVTMGPIFAFDRSSGFVKMLAETPQPVSAALATVPDVTALAGGVAIKRGTEIVAAIGVAGSPGGDKDEVCAVDGVNAGS